MSKTAGIERTRHDKLAKQIFREETADLPSVGELFGWNDLTLIERDWFRARAQREIETKQVLHTNRHSNRVAVV